MMDMKTLAEMPLQELIDEQLAAMRARAAADFMDGLEAWRAATDAANERLAKVRAEILRRGKEEPDGEAI